MVDVLLTNNIITNEALMTLDHGLSFYQTIGSVYDDQWNRIGAKHGDTLDIRLPPKYVEKDGNVYIRQDNVEEFRRMQVFQRHVGLGELTSQDFALRIDMFGRRFLQPAMAPLANGVDRRALATVDQIWNIVGVPGTAPTSLLTYGSALVRLQHEGVPLGNLHMCVDPTMQNVIVDANKTLFHAGAELETQYKRNKMGFAGGFSWLVDPHVKQHTSGLFTTGSTLLVDGVVADGAAVIPMKGAAVSTTGLFTKGDHFHIAGVNAVTAQTYVDSRLFREFVVTADTDSDAGGLAVVPIAPVIQGPTTGGLQNVTALPADSAPVTPFGPELTQSTYGVAYHPDAFAVAFVDLKKPRGTSIASTATHPSGIRLRYISDWFTKEDEEINRFDLLYAELCVRPEMACIVAG